MDEEVTSILAETNEAPWVHNKGDKLPNTVYHKIYSMQDDVDRHIYTDQTGTFTVRSYRGVQYIMVLVEIESKAIMVAGMRNHTSGEMVKAYQITIDRPKQSVIKPTLHILDSECSTEYKQAIKSNNTKCQLVPPQSQDQNSRESDSGVQRPFRPSTVWNSYIFPHASVVSTTRSIRKPAQHALQVKGGPIQVKLPSLLWKERLQCEPVYPTWH
jgi:hypothetical protein